MNDRVGAPAWVIGVVLLLGAGIVALLAAQGTIPALWRSWPLFLVLAGIAILLCDFGGYFALGGSTMVLGVLLYLHNVETLPLRRGWPWLLIAIALFVVADRLLARQKRESA